MHPFDSPEVVSVCNKHFINHSRASHAKAPISRSICGFNFKALVWVSISFCRGNLLLWIGINYIKVGCYLRPVPVQQFAKLAHRSKASWKLYSRDHETTSPVLHLDFCKVINKGRRDKLHSRRFEFMGGLGDMDGRMDDQKMLARVLNEGLIILKCSNYIKGCLWQNG